MTTKKAREVKEPIKPLCGGVSREQVMLQEPNRTWKGDEDSTVMITMSMITTLVINSS